jgi:hypothetical protein
LTSKTVRTILFLILKLAVSGTLLVYIFRKTGIGNIAGQLRSMDPWLFLTASALYLALIFLSAVRWRVLLGGGLPLGSLYSLGLIGSFFNNLLPGAVGGDAVKAYYLYRETRDGGKTIASVFMDRYVGYAGLLSIGLVSGLIAFRDLAALGVQWLMPALFAAFLAGSLAVFGMRIGRRFSTVANFYEFFHTTLRDRRVMTRAFLLSLLIQVLNILSIYLIARGIGQRPPFLALFVFVPIVVTVMMVPISISGFGLRESAFVVLFGLIGMPAEASTSISFLWFLSVAVGSLAGLVEYLRRGKQKGRGAAPG